MEKIKNKEKTKEGTEVRGEEMVWAGGTEGHTD